MSLKYRLHLRTLYCQHWSLIHFYHIQFIFSWTNKKGRIDSNYEFGINSAFNFQSFDILDDHYRFVEKNHKSPRKTTTTVSLKKLQVPEQDDYYRFVDLCRLNTDRLKYESRENDVDKETVKSSLNIFRNV